MHQHNELPEGSSDNRPETDTPPLDDRIAAVEKLPEPPTEPSAAGEPIKPIDNAAVCDLIKESNLVKRFFNDVEAAGLIGEVRNALAVFLCALSARLSNPINLTVQGASSSGKNYLLGRVALFLPDEMKKFLTGMTPKALMHAAEDEFEHKAIFIAEYEGVSRADYAIRTFQSEQVIEWQFADSTSEGIRTKTRKVKGPAAFLQATTRSLLHPENETRLLFAQMDESPELTRAILRRQAEEAASSDSPKALTNLYAPWHALIRSLKLTKVTVPFAPELVRYISPEVVRMRRDFPKLLELIRASAFLHQHQRDRTGDTIVADHRDYQTGTNIFQFSSGGGPGASVALLLRMAKWYAESDESSTPVFSVADIINDLEWGKSKAYEVLGRAQELGCVVETGKRGYYRFVRSSATPPSEFPEELPSFPPHP